MSMVYAKQDQEKFIKKHTLCKYISKNISKASQKYCGWKK